MKKIIAKIFSPWGLVPLIMALLCNFVVYSGCNALTRNWNLHSLAIPLDKQIPLIPWTIVIYFGCYIFWIINYILIYRRSREYAYRFFVADFLSRIVCLVFFLCYPTTLVRPAVEGEGIFYDAIRFLYKIDAPTNLFPSIHCLVSWFCFIGIISDGKIPKWYKVMSFFDCRGSICLNTYYKTTCDCGCCWRCSTCSNLLLDCAEDKHMEMLWENIWLS